MLAKIAILASAAVASNASASIVSASAGVLGGPTWGAPGVPTNTLPAGFVFAWDELQGVPVTNLQVDRGPGPWTAPPPASGLLTGVVDSHLIHWTTDHSGVSASGSVEFSGKIIGVIWNTTRLAMSDGLLGAPGTGYTGPYPGRKLDPMSRLWILPGVGVPERTLHFDLLATDPSLDFTEIRVLTVPVPAPGSLAMLGLGGIAACRRRRRAAR